MNKPEVGTIIEIKDAVFGCKSSIGSIAIVVPYNEDTVWGNPFDEDGSIFTVKLLSVSETEPFKHGYNIESELPKVGDRFNLCTGYTWKVLHEPELKATTSTEYFSYLLDKYLELERHMHKIDGVLEDMREEESFNEEISSIYIPYCNSEERFNSIEESIDAMKVDIKVVERNNESEIRRLATDLSELIDRLAAITA